MEIPAGLAPAGIFFGQIIQKFCMLCAAFTNFVKHTRMFFAIDADFCLKKTCR